MGESHGCHYDKLLGVSETVTKDVFPYYVYRCRYTMTIVHFEICGSRLILCDLNMVRKSCDGICEQQMGIRMRSQPLPIVYLVFLLLLFYVVVVVCVFYLYSTKKESLHFLDRNLPN